MSNAADQTGVTVTEVENWLKGYKEAWETLDPDRAARLFTEDASYRDNPYEEPHRGRSGIRKYWADVTGDEKDVEFNSDVLAVAGNTGFAHWHSEFTKRSNGAVITLDGMFVLEFEDNILCKSLKEWWHLKVVPAKTI